MEKNLKIFGDLQKHIEDNANKIVEELSEEQVLRVQGIGMN